MQCPLCIESILVPHFRGTTEVDVCPSCRGVWLDRGELDRLIDRPVDTPAPTDHEAPGAVPRDDDDHDDDDDRDDDDDDDDDDDRDDDDRKRGRSKQRKRRKSRTQRLGDFLEDVIDEIFD